MASISITIKWDPSENLVVAEAEGHSQELALMSRPAPCRTPAFNPGLARGIRKPKIQPSEHLSILM